MISTTKIDGRNWKDLGLVRDEDAGAVVDPAHLQERPAVLVLPKVENSGKLTPLVS